MYNASSDDILIWFLLEKNLLNKKSGFWVLHLSHHQPSSPSPYIFLLSQRLSRSPRHSLLPCYGDGEGCRRNTDLTTVRMENDRCAVRTLYISMDVEICVWHICLSTESKYMLCWFSFGLIHFYSVDLEIDSVWFSLGTYSVSVSVVKFSFRFIVWTHSSCSHFRFSFRLIGLARGENEF